MLKVLWFEVSIPAKYNSKKNPNGGWQDSLQHIINSSKDIELGIAFEGFRDDEVVIENVKYFSLAPNFSFIEKIKLKTSWKPYIDVLIPKALKVIEKFKPDVIHIFGTEWYWPQIVKYTNVPIIAHMQGSMPPYLNAWLPPGYSWDDERRFIGLNFLKQIKLRNTIKKLNSRMLMEEDNLRNVKYFMGRTDWDKKIVKLYNPNSIYYYCSEALRESFINNNVKWQVTNNRCFTLITTGCSVLLKGMDTILRTAKLLKERNFNFEWKIAGQISNKDFIEYKEKLLFSNLNIIFLGFINSDTLVNELISSDVFVLPSYCDNSPNSVCEAQYLGMPIISTYVGGIPSLLKNGKEGILIPANSPHELAETIIELANNKKFLQEVGNNSRIRALERHNPNEILTNLISCYQSVMSIKK